jgi:3-oxoacyl-[acyl-carrier-protein] synthase-1
VVHTGSDLAGFAAGIGAGALLAAVFGVLVIWLNTNQYATGLALSLFGAGFSAFAGIKYVQEKLPARPQFSVPVLGDSLDEISQSLRVGRSGIVISKERQELGFRSALTGAIKPVDAAAHFPRKVRKSMGETALYAAITATKAVAMSGCAEHLKSDRAGLLIGNDSCADPIEEILATVRADKSTGSLGSDKVIKALNSTATIHLGPMFGTRGISLSVSGACASGAHAIGWGWMLISSGMHDICVTGGTQELCWQSMAAFDGLRVFSMRLDNPTGAVRPFDRDRDGLVPGGGAASLILEEYEHAKRRGANIL